MNFKQQSLAPRRFKSHSDHAGPSRTVRRPTSARPCRFRISSQPRSWVQNILVPRASTTPSAIAEWLPRERGGKPASRWLSFVACASGALVGHSRYWFDELWCLLRPFLSAIEDQFHQSRSAARTTSSQPSSHAVGGRPMSATLHSQYKPP